MDFQPILATIGFITIFILIGMEIIHHIYLHDAVDVSKKNVDRLYEYINDFIVRIKQLENRQ